MKYIPVILFVITGGLTQAQKTENVILRKYTQRDGINSYNIRRVSQDHYGFIWIATQDGLSRFDGRNFVHYTKNSGARHGLCGVDIREIVADSADDLLWVLPGEAGINAINTLTGDVVKTIPISYSNSEDWNICMIRDGNYLWIGTFTGLKLYNIASGRFELIPHLTADSSNSVEFEVRSILKDSQGNIWVAYSGYGIVIYDGHSKAILGKVGISSLASRPGIRSIRILQSCEPSPGTILMATNFGLRRINYTGSYTLTIDVHPCKAVPGLNEEPLEYIALRKETVLVSGAGGFVQLDTSLEHYSIWKEWADATESKWLNAVQSIYTDVQNNLWLGCQEGLAFIAADSSPFEPYSYDRTSGIKLDHVRSVFPLPDGDILVGLRNGLVQIDHVTRVFTVWDKTHLYHHILGDPLGHIIVSRPDGMLIFDHGAFYPIAKIYPEFSHAAGIYINSHISIGDSLVIMGTESNSGILLWDVRHRTLRQIGKGVGEGLLASNIVNNIFRDSRDRLWVLSDNIITILDSGFNRASVLNLPYKLFFDMCEGGGCYWITAYGSGILQLDDRFRVLRVWNSSGGLSNDGVYQVYNLPDKRLLVTTNNGISVINPATLKYRNYYSGEGLHSNGFEEVCGMRRGGLIYAGGLNGFTVIDPSRFRTDTVPPLFYYMSAHVQLKGSSVDTGNLHLRRLDVRNTWVQANVSFVGLDFTSPSSVHYQYRVLPHDSSWLDLGAQSTLNLIGLAPGSYSLEARAANEDGYYSMPVGLTIIIRPKWYETLAFRLGLLVAIALSFYALYRFRIGEIRKQQKIRSAIAGDLHDDIGSLLNSVKVFAHLARREPLQEENFQHIDESLLQATTGLRDMIWVLDNSQDTISELMDRIRKFANPVTSASGIQLEYSYCPAEKPCGISKTEKRNLLLIAKEAITNSIKYSRCQKLSIQCMEDRKGISLRIEDDGIGFDSNLPSFGNGLHNMRERARQIAYDYQLETRVGGGTRIMILKK